MERTIGFYPIDTSSNLVIGSNRIQGFVGSWSNYPQWTAISGMWQNMVVTAMTRAEWGLGVQWDSSSNGRASRLHREGSEFKSLEFHHHGGLAEWFNAVVLKTTDVDKASRSSNLLPPAKINKLV